MTPPPALLERFGATRPRLVADTAAARVWRVETAAGAAALKVWDRGDPGNEAAGIGWMRDHPGPVAGVRDTAPGAVLLEWLDGPSLGDLARAGRAAEADDRLADMARALHAAPPPVAGLPDVARWFADLPGTGPLAPFRDRAARLSEGAPRRALHGDLHHDNVRRGARGWTAFDAKGVAGPLPYELANALRHPKGVRRADPARLAARAATFGAAVGVGPTVMLDWAAVKCALSLAWTGARDDDPDWRTLAQIEAARG